MINYMHRSTQIVIDNRATDKSQKKNWNYNTPDL